MIKKMMKSTIYNKNKIFMLFKIRVMNDKEYGSFIDNIRALNLSND